MRKKRNMLKRNSGFIVGCIVAAGASFFSADILITEVLPNKDGAVTILPETGTVTSLEPEKLENRTYETDAFTIMASGTIIKGVESEKTEPETDEDGNLIQGETDPEGTSSSDGSTGGDSTGDGNTGGDSTGGDSTGGGSTGGDSTGNGNTGGDSTGDGSTGGDSYGDGSTGGSYGDGNTGGDSTGDGSTGGSYGDGNTGGGSYGDGSTGGGSYGDGSTGGGSYGDGSTGGGSTGGSSGGNSIEITDPGNGDYSYGDNSGGTSDGDSGNGSGGSTGGSSDSDAWTPEDTIIPGICSRYIDVSELYSYGPTKLRLIRNEIFAVHGRIFKSQDLMDYFCQKSWYVPTYNPEDFDANMFYYLNDYEKANLKLILEYEDWLATQ